MRFQFCGHNPCPQWFIAQISVLTKITAIKMKLIFTQLITYYLQKSDISAKSQKLLIGTGLDYYQMNAVISTLYFILHNSVMFQISDIQLNKQLIDLGLPRQNVESITKSYKQNRQKLIEISLQRGKLDNSQIKLEYSIHQLIGCSGIQGRLHTKFAQTILNYKSKGEKTQTKMIICQPQLDDLIFQLQQAHQILKKIQIKQQ